MTLCVASQRVSIVVVYLVMTQSGNLWIRPRQLPLSAFLSARNTTEKRQQKGVP